jgi:uncharacterized protein (TIGR04540 family)
METKRSYKTQRDVAAVINRLVDSYWANEICEDLFIEKLLRLYSNNSNKIIKNGKFTTIANQTCGKRHLEVVTMILLEKDYMFN